MSSHDPELRAGDVDREATVTALREHFAAGRLTPEEFDERVDAAYAARTFGQLAALTRDLPAYPPAHPAGRPVAEGDTRPVERPVASADWRRKGMHAAWAAWTTAVLVNVVIWLIVSVSSGELVYFWPVWVAGPWGVVLLAGTLFGRYSQRALER